MGLSAQQSCAASSTFSLHLGPWVWAWAQASCERHRTESTVVWRLRILGWAWLQHQRRLSRRGSWNCLACFAQANGAGSSSCQARNQLRQYPWLENTGIMHRAEALQRAERSLQENIQVERKINPEMESRDRGLLRAARFAQLNAWARAAGRAGWQTQHQSPCRAPCEERCREHESRGARRALCGRQGKWGRLHGDGHAAASPARIPMAAAAGDAVSMDEWWQQERMARKGEWKREKSRRVRVLRGSLV